MSVQYLSFEKGIAASIFYLPKLAKKISWNCAMVRCTAGQALILFRYFTQIDFWTCTGNKIDDRSHGLRTPNEAFFHWYPKLLAWSDKFWEYLGYFCQTISTHFVSESLVHVFHYIFNNCFYTGSALGFWICGCTCILESSGSQNSGCT